MKETCNAKPFFLTNIEQTKILLRMSSQNSVIIHAPNDDGSLQAEKVIIIVFRKLAGQV